MRLPAVLRIIARLGTSIRRPSMANRGSRYLPALDGLRAVSVLMVCVHHIPGSPLTFLQGGHGVTAFFVISGYIITRLILAEVEDTGSFDVRSFYVRRVFRIMPLYLFVLGVYIVLMAAGAMPEKRGAFFASLPFYLLYLPEYAAWNFNAPFALAWSLGIEEKFYAVWPLLGFRATGSARARLALLVALGVSCAVAPIIDPTIGRYFMHYYPITVGCALATIEHARFRSPDTKWKSRGAMYGALLSVTLIHLSRNIGPNWAALATATFPLAVAAVVITTTRPDHPMSWPPLAYLGRISFGVYLVNILALDLVDRLLPRGPWPVVALGGIALAVLAAELAGQTIERPMAQFGRRLSTAPRQPANFVSKANTETAKSGDEP